jgi:hypothetical protein
MNITITTTSSYHLTVWPTTITTITTGNPYHHTTSIPPSPHSIHICTHHHYHHHHSRPVSSPHSIHTITQNTRISISYFTHILVHWSKAGIATLFEQGIIFISLQIPAPAPWIDHTHTQSGVLHEKLICLMSSSIAIVFRLISGI